MARSPSQRIGRIGLVAGAFLILALSLAGCEKTTTPGESKPSSATASQPSSAPSAQAYKLPAKASLALKDIRPEPVPATAPASQPALPERAVEPLKRAQSFYDADKLVEAQEQLQTARRFAPNHPQVERLAALILSGLGNEAEASGAAKKALAAIPDSLVLHYLSGRSLFMTNQDEDAIRELRLALRCPDAKADNPKLPLTHLHLAMALERAGYWTAAAGEYEEFLRMTAKPPAEYFKDRELNAFLEANPALVPVQLGQLYLRLHDGEKATAAFYRAMSVNGKFAEARQGYVRGLVATGRREDALASIAVLLSDFPEHPQTAPVVVDAISKLGDPGKVIGELMALLTESNNPQAATEILIAVVNKTGRTDLADVLLTGMLERNPTHLPTYWRLVRYRLEAKKPALAFALLEKAVGVDPLASFGLLDLMRAEPARARELVETARAEAEKNPGKLPTQVAAALVFLATDDAEKSSACAARVEKNAPQAPVTLLLSVQSLLAADRWADVLSQVDKAFKAGLPEKISPVRLHLLSGRAYLGLDQYDKAIASFTDALNFNRKNAEALRWRGDAYRRNGEPALAERDYRSALELAPDDGAILEQLFEMLILRGDFEAAETVSRKLDKTLHGSLAHRRVEVALDLRRLLSDEETAPLAYVVCVRRLTELLNRAPSEQRTSLLLIQAYSQQLEFDKATEVAEKALQYAPRDEELLTMLAELRFAQGRIDQAIDLYRGLLARFPNRILYKQKLSELLIYTERYEEARQLLTGVLSGIDLTTLSRLADGEQNSKNRSTYDRAILFARLILESYILADDFAAAEKQLAAWIKDLGEQPQKEPQGAADEESTPDVGSPALQLRGYLARLALQTGRFAEAARLLQAMHQARPDNLSYAYVLTQALIRNGQLPEAKKLAKEMYDKHNDILFVGLEAMADYYADGFEAADKLLGEARFTDQLTKEGVRDPALEGKIEEQRRVAMMRLELMEADKRYDQALQLAEDLADLPWLKVAGSELGERFLFRNWQISLLKNLGRYADAMKRIDEWAKEDPAHFAEWQNLRSAVLTAQGNLPAADKILQEIIKQVDVMGHPTRWNRLTAMAFTELARALNNLGYAWADRTENLGEAEKMIRRAVSLDNQVVSFNRVDRRRAPIEQSEAYADSLGWVLYKQGEFGRAFWWLQFSMQLGGQDPTIYDHLGDTYYRLGYRHNARYAWRSSWATYERPIIPSLVVRATEPDEKLKSQLKAKLEALTAGQVPPVAPIAAERPASRPGK